MKHIRLILLTQLAWLTVTAEAQLRVTEHLLIGGGMANNYITEDSKGRLMLHEHRNVSEAAYESGFSSMPYFRACFKEEYGMTPTEYLKNI